ncbi:MAG: LppP/LprE family lipoprotein [Vicinamibacteria bacterium]|nr:LppP/LprE family lipoprotein [Vicinamibacteria bacterium]
MRNAWIGAWLLTAALAGAGERSWLDAGLVQWNAGAAPLPTPPAASPGGAEPAGADTRCAPLAREATTGAQRAVAAAGWLLRDGASTVRDRLEVVRGFGAFGGQCRSHVMQAFVFVDGTFAGTLSPRPMDPRTDGELLAIDLGEGEQVEATYARYLDANALCCSSGRSRARFGVRADGGVPRLVWLSVADVPEPRED